jgi:hypothetical protein
LINFSCVNPLPFTLLLLQSTSWLFYSICRAELYKSIMINWLTHSCLDIY